MAITANVGEINSFQLHVPSGTWLRDDSVRVRHFTGKTIHGTCQSNEQTTFDCFRLGIVLRSKRPGGIFRRCLALLIFVLFRIYMPFIQK